MSFNGGITTFPGRAPQPGGLPLGPPPGDDDDEGGAEGGEAPERSSSEFPPVPDDADWLDILRIWAEDAGVPTDLAEKYGGERYVPIGDRTTVAKKRCPKAVITLDVYTLKNEAKMPKDTDVKKAKGTYRDASLPDAFESKATLRDSPLRMGADGGPSKLGPNFVVRQIQEKGKPETKFLQAHHGYGFIVNCECTCECLDRLYIGQYVQTWTTVRSKGGKSEWKWAPVGFSTLGVDAMKGGSGSATVETSVTASSKATGNCRVYYYDSPGLTEPSPISGGRALLAKDAPARFEERAAARTGVPGLTVSRHSETEGGVAEKYLKYKVTVIAVAFYTDGQIVSDMVVFETDRDGAEPEPKNVEATAGDVIKFMASQKAGGGIPGGAFK